MLYSPKDGFPYYLDLVKETECLSLFSTSATFSFLEKISEENSTYRYAPDKWSIKQIVGHITDHERIKMYRAFQLSRQQEVQLWGYDQEFLVENSRFEELTFKELVTDLKNVRMASLSFVQSLSEAQLQTMGVARHHKASLVNFLRTVIGHERHHINIIKERYLGQQTAP